MPPERVGTPSHPTPFLEDAPAIALPPALRLSQASECAALFQRGKLFGG